MKNEQPKKDLTEARLVVDKLQNALADVIVALRPLSREEQLRVLNTAIVFHGMEVDIRRFFNN